MYCKNCGNEVEKDAKFCGYCGTALVKEEIETSIIEEATVLTTNNKRPTGVSILAAIFFIFGVFFVIVGILIVSDSHELGSIILSLMGVPFILLGYGLWKLKWWSRIGAIVGLLFIIIVKISKVGEYFGGDMAPWEVEIEIGGFLGALFILSYPIIYLSEENIKNVFQRR